jgi:hypothetical protein
VGVGKGVAKVSWNPGQFLAVLVLIETVGGGSDGARFKQRTRNNTSMILMGVFEVKKEIRINKLIKADKYGGKDET